VTENRQEIVEKLTDYFWERRDLVIYKLKEASKAI
jgi:hypothetical protein